MSSTLREIVLGLSFAAVGLAAWLVIVNAYGLLHDRRLHYLWPMLMLGGYAFVVALVAEVVFGAPSLPPAWRTYLYAGALLASAAGMLGTALTVHRYGKRETDHRRR